MSDKVIGVRFKKAGKIYYFNPLSIPFEAGEGVIVETSRGIEFGEVVIGAREIEQKELDSCAHKAKMIVSKSGELLSYEEYRALMDAQGV